jgi:phosphoribosylaminoimidazole-succinocarboxamide synthase
MSQLRRRNNMPEQFLTEIEAREVVDKYIASEKPCASTQDILNSGAVPRLKSFYVRPGKVSDSIYGGVIKHKGNTYENAPLQMEDGTPLRIMVRTDRISTHDINRGSIPFKDQILATNHNYMRRMLAPAIGTSQIDVPGLEDNAVVIAAENLEQFGFENVLRAYMAKSSTSTSLYQHYIKGERLFCGHKLPKGLIANGPLPYVMDTPSTKSEEHDESLSPEEMFIRGIVTANDYAQVRNGSLFAFGMVSQFLGQKGLIAVDTKTEHGRNRKGKIVSQDEIWTMDSSRFWLSADYANQMKQLARGIIEELNPTSYSKEFARGFSEGEKGYTDEQRAQIAVRYILGIQHLLGKRFEPDMRSREERVVSGLQTIVEQLVA